MTPVSFPSVIRDGLTLIIGLGETGVAAACWCAKRGASLRVADTRAQPAGLNALGKCLDVDKIDFRLGPDALSADVLDGVKMLVLSPGLVPTDEPIQSLLNAARRQGIDVVGEIELFARALNDLREQGYASKVLAVTGTNGKTTVTAMTRHVARASGYSVVAAGNISPAALTALDSALENDALPDVWILELSSFQLVTTHSLRAHAAAVLNISQDHIDWHGSFDAYVQAKAALLAQAQIHVINRDDVVVRALVADPRSANVRSFGSDVPAIDEHLGLEDRQAVVWLCAASAATSHPTDGALTRLMPADALRVRGQHNALNAQVAMILTRTLGAGWAPMLHALRDYLGEPHRMEYVRTVAGVDFINDSKGTNVGATVAALNGLQQPTILIAGGLAKGQQFKTLADAAKVNTRAVVLLGQDAQVLAAALSEAGVTSEYADSMADAVTRAFSLARPGDAVMLSPACASMDMFSNYVERGHCFVDHVTELALDQGEVA